MDLLRWGLRRRLLHWRGLEQVPQWRSRWLLCLAWSGCLLWGYGLFLGVPSVQADERTEIEYSKGIVAYDKGNYIDALEHFRTVVSQTPDDANAQFYFGLSLSRTGEFAAAITALEKALQLDPSMQYVYHHLGVAYFQDERYGDAQIALQRAEQFDPDNATTQLYLGYALYQLKEYEAALHHLERALALDATLESSVLYYRGLALYALERDREAREAFTSVTTTDPASILGQSAQRYLEAIKQREREQRLLRLQGIVSFVYDDNVILEPNDEAIAFGDQADGSMVLGFGAELVPVRTPRWRLGAGYQFFQSLHFELTEFDIRSHTAGVFASLKLDPVTVRFDADYNSTLLDNEAFSETIALQPSLSFPQSKNLFAVVSVRYRLDDYVDTVLLREDPAVRERDGWNLRAGFDEYVLFNRQRSYARFSYHFDAQRNDGSDWEYDGHNLALELRTPLWAGIILQVEGTYTWRNYLHINSFDQEPLGMLSLSGANRDMDRREDNRLTAAITLQRALGSYLLLSAGYAHVSNISTIPFFDYRRNIFTLALTGRY